MEASEDLIGKIVRQVVTEISQGTAAPAVAPVSAAGDNGVFDSIEDAINAAEKAQLKLDALSLETRKEIITAIRSVGIDNARDFSERTFAETGMGRVEDKIQKHLLASKMTPGVEDLKQTAWTGDHGLTVVEMAPWGLIGAFTPSTHPVPTMLNNTISMIAAGNTAVFNAHPRAKKVSAYAVQKINEAAVAAGGPPNIITCVHTPTLETGKVIFTHPKVKLLSVTGGPAVVRAAMKSGKKVIAAGPGNPPVVVDETADIDKAARDIIAGATFDNNLLCIAEKEIFVVDSVCDQLKAAMVRHAGIELSANQVEALSGYIFPRGDNGQVTLNRTAVGRDATVLAENIGLQVPATTKILFGETSRDHLFVEEEQMTTFIPVVRTPDVDTAIAWAKEAEHGFHHTAMIHSRNIEALSKMARVANTTIFVKNGASSAGLGVGGEGFISFSIASPTGEGIVSARVFTRQRRCVLVDYFRIV